MGHSDFVVARAVGLQSGVAADGGVDEVLDFLKLEMEFVEEAAVEFAFEAE